MDSHLKSARERQNLEPNANIGIKGMMALGRKAYSFNLPYWKDLLIRHNFVVKHIEKNVAEAVLATYWAWMERIRLLLMLSWT